MWIIVFVIIKNYYQFTKLYQYKNYYQFFLNYRARPFFLLHKLALNYCVVSVLIRLCGNSRLTYLPKFISSFGSQHFFHKRYIVIQFKTIEFANLVKPIKLIPCTITLLYETKFNLLAPVLDVCSSAPYYWVLHYTISFLDAICENASRSSKGFSKIGKILVLLAAQRERVLIGVAQW